MSERETYPPGVPCWVDTLQPDAEAAIAFYEAVFDWDFERGEIPGDPPGSYSVARIRGRDVAAVSSPPSAMPVDVAAWTTYVRVDDSDAAVERALAAGGSVVIEPFDALGAGRSAMLADPDGARFSVWEPREHQGSQIVNEPGAWSMSVLTTPSRERAADFYGELFGWRAEPFDAGGEEAMLCRLPGYVGGEPEQPVPRDVVAVIVPSREDGIAAAWGVDFWIGDVEAAVAAASASGGRVLTPPYRADPFLQAILADPGGAAFTVSQLVGSDQV